MKTIRRYYLREFFKYFAILICGFTAVAIVAEFFDKVNEFYSHKAPASVIIRYLFFNAPGIMLYTLPFASFFSILITLGLATKWREIIIIRASGISTKKVFQNFIVLGAVMAVLALILGETLVPRSTRKAAWIRKIEVLKEPPKITYQEQALWLRGIDRSLIRIDGFAGNEDRVTGTSIFYFSPDFTMEKRIEADSAIWKDGGWTLKNVTVFDFAGNATKKYDALPTNAIEDPKIFREEMKKPEEMNFAELYEYYTRLEKTGFKSLKYVVRLYEKLSYPLINFIMVLLGLSFGLHSKWGGGIKAAGAGVIICVIYWLIYSTSISLGNAGIVPAPLAPWIAPALFGITAGVMYFKIRD